MGETISQKYRRLGVSRGGITQRGAKTQQAIKGETAIRAAARESGMNYGTMSFISIRNLAASLGVPFKATMHRSTFVKNIQRKAASIRAAQQVITPKQEFTKSLLQKQGYDVKTTNQGQITAKRGDRQLIITRTGETLSAPSSAVLRPKFLPSVHTQQRAKIIETAKREQIAAAKRESLQQDIQVSLLEKQGYITQTRGKDVIAVKGNRQLLITSDGRTVIAPKSARIERMSIPTVRQQQRAQNNVRKNKGFLSQFLLGIVDFPVDVAKGLKNIAESAKMMPSNFKLLLSSLSKINNISNDLKKYKKSKDPKTRQKLTRSINIYQKTSPQVKKELKNTKNAVKLLSKQETILAISTVALLGIGFGAGAIGGITAKIVGVGMRGVGVAAVGLQGLETIKDPTPRNIGRLTFFMIPTAVGITRAVRKLSPNFQPTLKNIKKIKTDLIARRKSLNKTIKTRRGLRRIHEQRKIKAINQALKEIRYLESHPGIIGTRDFAPQIYTKSLKLLQGSYRRGIHVSTQPKAGKLFGKSTKKDIKLPTKKEIIKKAQPKAKVIKKIRDVKAFGRINKIILAALIKSKVVLGGGRAQNLQMSLLKQRLSKDFDGKIGRGAREIIIGLAKKLNKEFNSPGRFVWNKLKHGTWRLYDKLNKQELLDITNTGSKRTPFVTNKQGLRVESVKSLIVGKADALSKLQRYQRKGVKDLKDLIKLTGNKVTAKDILPDRYNPSGTFEVVRQPKGMGKDRLAFDETHMYFDFEAPLNFAHGKAYSIIKFPVVKISKFPKKLRLLINKAARGELSVKQSNALRRSLNRHIKANKNKFFISPKTAAKPKGEREIVLTEGSRFIKDNVFKTFDSDLRKFLTVVETTFSKPTKISLFKRFANAYKKSPFLQLKARLGKQDLSKARRFTKLLSKTERLTKFHKKLFLTIFNKIIRPSAKVAKITTKKIVATKVKTISLIKRTSKVTVGRSKIIINQLKRKVVSLMKITRAELKQELKNLLIFLRTLPSATREQINNIITRFNVVVNAHNRVKLMRRKAPRLVKKAKKPTQRGRKIIKSTKRVRKRVIGIIRRPIKITRTTKPRKTISRKTPPRKTTPRKPSTRKTTPRTVKPRKKIIRKTTTRETTPRGTIPRTTTPRRTIPRGTTPRRTAPRKTTRTRKVTDKRKTKEALPKLPQLTWRTKLPRGIKLMVNAIVRVGGRNKELKFNLPPNMAIKKIRSLIDNTTSRSFQLKIVGITKRKDIGKVSLAKFRRRKGTDPRVLAFVEKSKYAIDTKGEKTGLLLARKLKR